MKVAVSGKGGIGKTTVAGTLARQLAQRGHTVVALDCDPSPNLGITLGLSPTELATITPVINGLWDSGYTHNDPRPDPEELLQRYGKDAPEGIRLLLTGLIEPTPGRCVCCGSHASTRALFGELSGDDRFVVADLEAGLTDLAWAKPGEEDTVILLAESSVKSIEIARRGVGLARGMGVQRILCVANRCAAEDDANRLASAVDLEVFSIPEDAGVEIAARLGVAPVDSHPGSPAVAAVARIADALEGRP